jgi:hypothetical protein
MRKSVRQAIVASAFAAVLLGGAAHAATTTFTDRSAFQGGLTTTIVDDYANPGYHSNMSNSAVTAVLGQSTYASSNDNTRFWDGKLVAFDGFCSYYSSVPCTPVDATYHIGFEDTSLSTGTGVFAVGFDYLEYGALAKITFGDGSTQSLNLLSPIPPTFPDTSIYSRFFGIQSDLGIKSIDVYGVPQDYYDPHTDQKLGVYASGTLYIDNLTLGSNGSVAAVPEPATWAMMIVGFFGVGGLARRKARVLAA